MGESSTEAVADQSAASVAYASFTRRFRALVLDSAVVAGSFVLLLVLGELTRDVPGSGRVLGIAILASLVLYEPIFVSRYGGTLGHRAANLRVVEERSGDNPSFLRALGRFGIKSILGLPSFVTMALTRRHQAVHDVLTHTTVRVRDVEKAAPIDFHYARSSCEPPGAPSRTRRVVVALSYISLAYVLVGVVGLFLQSEACVLEGVCSRADERWALVLGVLWLGAAAGSIIGAWRARLWGCRLRPDRSETGVRAI
jgi:uncharacterized RDD family membrane protein YckC